MGDFYDPLGGVWAWFTEGPLNMLASVLYLYSGVVLKDHGESKAFLWEECGRITVISSRFMEALNSRIES